VRGLDVCREIGVSTAVWRGLAQKQVLWPQGAWLAGDAGMVAMVPCRKTSKIKALQKQFERY